MKTWEMFWFGVYPYICLTIMLLGLAFRYVYAPYTWNSRSTAIMEKRWLLLGAPLFHVGVLLALFGHIAGLLLPDAAWAFLLGSSDLHDTIAQFVGRFIVVFMLVGLGVLLARKMVFARVRAASNLIDYIIICLLFVNIYTGLLQVFVFRAPMFELLGPWLRGVLSFSPDPSFATAGPAFMQVHIVSAFTIFALLPFSRLVHILSAPVTYAVRPLIVLRKRFAGL